MRRLKQISICVLLGGLLALSSCHRCEQSCLENPLELRKGNLQVYSTISAMTTRATDTEWQAGDAIGLYAVKSGETASMATLFGGFANVKYTTPDQSGRFSAATKGINVADGVPVDIVAYYPYQETMPEDLTYKFNTKDQSNLPAIDLLYSNNAKSVAAGNSVANLHFSHKLSLVVFDITSDGTTLANSSVKIEEVIVDGSMDLATGTVTAGTTKGAPTIGIKEITAGKKYQGVAILPLKNLKTKRSLLPLTALRRKHKSKV